MLRFVSLYIWLSRDLQLVLSAPTLGFGNNPRLLLSKDVSSSGIEYPVSQKSSVFFYDEDSEEMYVGGTDFVLKLDVDDYRVKETFRLKNLGHQKCQEGQCENVITVIEQFQGSLFVCGTNGNNPQCWKLFSSVNNQTDAIVESYEGRGISPFVYTHNSLSLTADGDLYSAVPLNVDGSSLQFRRKAGGRTNLWMYDGWVSEPTFISASWVRRMKDPDNDKIYVFFREKNSDQNPEADPWISRVARVCKVDEGGTKRFLQNTWTSFLKARLVCGFAEESLYFNRLQDIYVMHAEDWKDTRVYALFSLFTSSWNSTAVCIYSIGMIEDVFENSTFKGYNKEVPEPRPGTCVKNSRTLPHATVNVVKDYPEMTDWVHSVHFKEPFYISNNNYTNIAVDRVQAADQHTYNVLLLATDSGTIHKVLETGSEPFIISETKLPNCSSIKSMKLVPKKKKLVVGLAERISILDLQRCQEYNQSCADCVLARDPYCAWTEFRCTPTTPGGIQNIIDGNISLCTSAEAAKSNRTKREAASPAAVNLTTVHSVPQSVPFYLSCPIESYHAVYTWEHGGQSHPCLQMQSNCLHLIPAMAQENYGHYHCVSKEKDYTKVVKTYQLTEQIILDTNKHTKKFDNTLKTNRASAAASQKEWIVRGLAVLGILRYC
ncbi:semaphorin-7A isoform X1 [Pungitius pungitius]|uniref:semaphorin-7A isoform X1 n=1 Tax=Pungitius pungitius TaxID=134920 RepID=UPI002E123BBA